MDRAYNDYKLYAQWTENGIYFVTRLKDNADYMLLEVRDVPQNRNILADELIMFDGVSGNAIITPYGKRKFTPPKPKGGSQ